MYVKICGISDQEIAKIAVENGADALGFVFAPSIRKITPEKAKEIISYLPSKLDKVGVFVNMPRTEIEAIASYTGLTTLQLHGDETKEECQHWSPIKIWKAFRVKDRAALQRISDYDVASILLDAYSEHSYGGTGKVANWDLAREAFNYTTAPLILAGGLNIDNILKALQLVKPSGIDISSGVERDGKKDPYLIKEFMRKVRENS